MTNSEIADVFEQMGDLLDFDGANPFRVRAYRNAARTLRDYPQSLSDIADDSTEKLQEIEGIGKDLALKVAEMCHTGKLQQLEDLKAKVPSGALDMLRVPGLGPKKAAALFKELGIASLEALRVACETQQVRKLKGFAAKTEETILAGIELAASANLRFYWADADVVVNLLREHLKDVPGVERIEFAGSYRRGRETIGDLDILAIAPSPLEAMNRLEAFPQRAQTIARGDTKMSIRLATGMQVDMRVVEAKSFGAALQYFTGSKEHNVVIRGIAKDRGLKINEWGVFRIGPDQKETYIAGATEEDVYATLDMPCFPPELRENRLEFELQKRGKLPKLLETVDLLGDLHAHTKATDGSATIQEMIDAARARGLKYLAITDHSQRVSMANGLDPKRARAQWKEIDKIRKTIDDDFVVLKGIECDILEKGGMDLPDDVLAEADWVLASVHYGQRQDRKQITERILGAVENPHVDCIAHPTGRLVNRREAYEVDLEAVMKAVKKHGKCMELNANPARLDLNDVHCAMAKAMGIPIVINTDAHSPGDLGLMRYGVLQGRRGGLTKADVANSKPAKEFLKLIAAKA